MGRSKRRRNVRAMVFASARAYCGYRFPGWKTFQGIQAVGSGCDVSELHEYLCYWLAFGLVITAEACFGTLIGWIPLWHEIKMGLFLFLSVGGGAKNYILAHLNCPPSPVKSKDH